METALEPGVLSVVLALVAALFAGVVAWKSFEYVLMERRRRRGNPPPDDFGADPYRHPRRNRGPPSEREAGRRVFGGWGMGPVDGRIVSVDATGGRSAPEGGSSLSGGILRRDPA